MPHRKAGIPPEIRPGGAQDGIAVQGIRKARPAREQLREHRCKRRPAVMPAAAHDERKVQPHVQNGGGDEEIERRARIAHGAKEPRDDVVKDGRADPAEDDEQVPVGVIVIGGGRLHEAQKGRRERHRHRRDNDRDRNAQQIAHADRAAHARLVARAERLRDLDGKARSEPVDKAEHEEGDGPREPHPRERRRPHRVPHDDGIRHVVQLLEDASDKYGERKEEYEFERAPLGEIFHKYPCLPRVSPRLHDIICRPPKNASVLPRFPPPFSGFFRPARTAAQNVRLERRKVRPRLAAEAVADVGDLVFLGVRFGDARRRPVVAAVHRFGDGVVLCKLLPRQPPPVDDVIAQKDEVHQSPPRLLRQRDPDVSFPLRRGTFLFVHIRPPLFFGLSASFAPSQYCIMQKKGSKAYEKCGTRLILSNGGSICRITSDLRKMQKFRACSAGPGMV